MTRYTTFKALGLCPACRKPHGRPELSAVFCDACLTDKQHYAMDHADAIRQRHVVRREARWDAPGPNMLAHCGQWHLIPTWPPQCETCGWIVEENDV